VRPRSRRARSVHGRARTAGSSSGTDAMPHDLQRREAAARLPGVDVHTAVLRIRIGRTSWRAKADVSTRGRLAVTGLVVRRLLSRAAIVAVATRKLPQGAMPAGMKRSRW